jgi:hypothetical protein
LNIIVRIRKHRDVEEHAAVEHAAAKIVLETLATRHHRRQRSGGDGDTENGQQRARAGRPQAFQPEPEDFPQ